MRFEIFVVILSAYCFTSVLSGTPMYIPKLICKPGIHIPPCLNINCQEPCKKGYTCKAGHCCRDSVCPKGYVGENRCNVTPGEQRCPNQFDCIDGFCCTPKKVIPPKPKCPKRTTPVPGKCRRFPFPYRRVSSLTRRCPKGSHCYSGTCCRTLTNAELCPQVKPPRDCSKFDLAPDECKSNDGCSKNSLCCKGPCGVKFCYKL